MWGGGGGGGVGYLWNCEPLKPSGTPSFLYSPVQNCRKFSAVLGVTSAYSSIMILGGEVVVVEVVEK